MFIIIIHIDDVGCEEDMNHGIFTYKYSYIYGNKHVSILLNIFVYSHTY
jgi:hypothetical protein